MSFKYTIKEITTAHITVDFDNGNWAQIPIKKGESKEEIEERIRQYSLPMSKSYDSVSDVPFEVNDTAELLDFHEREEARSKASVDATNNISLNYKEQRWSHYPSPTLQLEALYKARQGDNTLINKVDKCIEELKARFPKDAANVKVIEYNAAWDEGSIDDTDPKKKRISSYMDIDTMVG